MKYVFEIQPVQLGEILKSQSLIGTVQRMRIQPFSLAVTLSIFCSTAQCARDRVISLGNTRYNGTSKVEFTSQALGQADFFKLDPAPNATTFDSKVSLSLRELFV